MCGLLFSSDATLQTKILTSITLHARYKLLYISLVTAVRWRESTAQNDCQNSFCFSVEIQRLLLKLIYDLIGLDCKKKIICKG